MRLRLGSGTLLMALAACQSGSAPTDPNTTEREAGSTPIASATVPSLPPSASSAPASREEAGVIRSCEAQIGAAAATELATQCRAVSPATRPPCNAANSCALIRDETARGCAMLDPAAAQDAGCVDPQSAQAAVAAIERYYEAIAARDYGTAFALWDGETAGGKSRSDFERGFANTRTTSVTSGKPGFVEGAAGSRFVTIPVTVRSTLTDGSRQHFTGTYTLRRVAPIDGATAEDRRWHIDSATLERG